MGVHEIRTFAIGDGLAMPLPAGFALGPNEKLEVSADRDTLIVRRIPTSDERLERRVCFRDMLDELAKLPKPPEVQGREPIEFPERTSL